MRSCMILLALLAAIGAAEAQGRLGGGLLLRRNVAPGLVEYGGDVPRSIPFPRPMQLETGRRVSLTLENRTDSDYWVEVSLRHADGIYRAYASHTLNAESGTTIAKESYYVTDRLMFYVYVRGNPGRPYQFRHANLHTITGPDGVFNARTGDVIYAGKGELVGPKGDERAILKTAKADAKRAEGAKFPPAKFDLKRPLNEEKKKYIVPKGPDRGNMQPANKAYKTRDLKPKDPKGSGDSQAPLFFREYAEIADATPSTHTLVPEPSVAENGQTVMTTGNYWMALSLDGGQTFTSVNPTTIFPQDYGGFCCDQVLTYVPQVDLFVWLLQYMSDAKGRNAIRIAVQTTAAVRSSKGTSWTYWDFTNDVFASSGELDYNDMSYGDTFLYWTSSVGGGGNRYVIRVPLKQLRAMGTVNFQFTGSTAATWSHVSQSGRKGVYWAGHKDSSTMTVYSMLDADGFYSWRDVAVNSWPNGTISSTAANGTNWLQDSALKTYVRAAAVRGDSVYFAWNAAKGGGFPQPHVQIAEINTSTWKLQSQMQVWNPDFAFAYPNFDMNAEGQLGMIVAFGGGTFNASSGVGVWGDFVIYYPRLSEVSQSNYGHYHTSRRSGSTNLQWVGAGYTHQKDGTVLPYYVRYSR